MAKIVLYVCSCGHQTFARCILPRPVLQETIPCPTARCDRRATRTRRTQPSNVPVLYECYRPTASQYFDLSYDERLIADAGFSLLRPLL